MPDGFLHDGRRVYALRYTLAADPPLRRDLIVWLRSDGYAENPWVRRPDGRPVVFTRPGDTLLVRRERATVEAVEVWRGEGQHSDY